MSGTAGIERNAGDERARDAGLKKLAVNLNALFRMVSRKFHAIVRDPRPAHPLFEEPFHGTPAFEVHGGRHDGFHFVPQVIGGEGAVSVLRHQRLQESGESRIGIPAAGLAKHFAQHVNDPRTLAVDDLFVGGGGLRGIEARAQGERADISRCFGGARQFLNELPAVAREPNVQSVGEEQRQIIRDGFVNPLVAIARPCDDVAPPLMRDFMVGNQLGEMFLGGGAQPGALLGFRTQKGIGGNVEQAGRFRESARR